MADGCFSSQPCNKHLCKSGNLRVTKIHDNELLRNYRSTKVICWYGRTKKSWTVHFKTDLFDNKTVTMPAKPSALIIYVEKNFSGHKVSCCYEAGCCGYWIARALLQKGWEVRVVNPGDVQE